MDRTIKVFLCFIGFFLLNKTYSQDVKQPVWKLIVVVKDRNTHLPLDYAHAHLEIDGKFKIGSYTDEKGQSFFSVHGSGTYTLVVSYIGKETYKEKVYIDKNTRLEVLLRSSVTAISEVYVTGRESRGMTSSTGIGQKAISHIQPSSFSDLLELIPGGLSKNPVLDAPNMIALREVGRPMHESKYNTSSLGTAFYMDGRPLNNDAHMQSVIRAWTNYIDEKDFRNAGVDMRTISTDDIDSVEIIRGIPSVQYGDLTSGLITITRKKGGNKLDGRVKADLKSILFHLGKGIELSEKNMKLNVSADYLDHNPTPYSLVSRYNRLTGSVRGEKIWEKPLSRLTLSSSLDYTGSFDKVREDADSDVGLNKDQYHRSYNRYAAMGRLAYRNNKRGFLRSLELTASVDYEKQMDKRFYQFRTQAGGPNYEITAKTEGQHSAGLLERMYMANYNVDGRPFYANVKGMGEFAAGTTWCSNIITAGVEWKYSKNFGKGHLFDPKKPPHFGIRPRPFKDVPGESVLGLFIENKFILPFKGNLFKLNTGLRSTNLLGLNRKYRMSRKTYIDPRINLQWQLPKVNIGSQALRFALTGGIGWHSKTPTLNILYPEKRYLDLMEFIFINASNYLEGTYYYRTYVIDPTNYNLKPARNRKWELRADADYAGYHLSVNVYQENMSSGFRTTEQYDIYDYTIYSRPKDYDFKKYGYYPPRDVLDKKDIQTFGLHTMWENGSRTYKRGWEYTFETPRIQPLATRITLSGARQYTKYSNSVPIWALKETSAGDLNHEEVIGRYKEDDSYVRWRSVSRLNFDTYLPKIGFIFSTSFQCMWNETVEWPTRYEFNPYEFMLLDKVVRPWTDENRKKYPVANLLGRTDHPFNSIPDITPFYMSVNLKATKKLYGDALEVSLFVNQLIDYYPKKKERPTSRHASAYFGAEARFNL